MGAGEAKLNAQMCIYAAEVTGVHDVLQGLRGLQLNGARVCGLALHGQPVLRRIGDPALRSHVVSRLS